MRKLNHQENIRRIAARKNSCRAAFTLLEILLVLALMTVLLVGLSSIVRLFSRNYAANERRVGRAQLARSISQMLSDDLGAAIQDPIVAVDNDPSRQYVRHFGLRGDSRSLQIDVVQPSSFTPVADADENRRVMSGGDKRPGMKQAPELKTIFYEFVPINEPQKLPGETDDDESPSASANGTDLGSTLTGSLAGSVDATVAGLSTDALKAPLFWDGVRPLEQKFGLSRRELDYETPEGNDEESESDATKAYFDEGAGNVNVSQLSGSLSSVPDASLSTLVGSSASAGLTSTQSETFQFKPPLSAAQIAMDCDDGATWAPEVLDCRFRYFDGDQWFDSWDSLEKNGLPVAIKVELKLAPLDDVDAYRSSPLFFSLPLAPSVSELDKIAQRAKEEETDDGVNTSRLTGTLVGAAGSSSGDGEPVDVFNSYRTPTAIVAALRGTPQSSKTLTPYAQTTLSNALAAQNQSSPASSAGTSSNDLMNDAPTSILDASFSGTLGGGLDDSTEAADASSVGGSLSDTSASGASGGSGDAFLDQANALTASGVVYNEAGVCVDFSNDGTYTTLEQIAKEIGVSEPSYYEVVAYLPTTPFSRAKTIERRQPTNARRGMVATNSGRNGNVAGGRRNSGANPYATGVARAPRERRVNNRVANERTSRDRQTSERTLAGRNAADRDFSDRRSGERQTSARQQRERGGNERVARNRNARERIGANGGTGAGGFVSNDEGAPIGAEVSGMVADPTGPDLLGGADNMSPFASPDAGLTGMGGAVGGGLGGDGGSTSLGRFDPFAIVDQAAGELPYADNAFTDVDANLDAVLVPGMIADPTGVGTVQTPDPTAPPATRQSQKQTWIRGKK